VLVVRAGQVASAERLREPTDLLALAVVEDPGLVRGLQGDRRGDRRQEHVGRFVVRRDEDGHARSWRWLAGRVRLSVDTPQGHRVQRQAERVVDLDDEQRDRDPPPLRRDRASQAPCQICDRDGHGEECNAVDQRPSGG
jgi:hypothetical protein